MSEVRWEAATDGRDWIDVAIGGLTARVMIDLGLVDPLHAVGFELEPDFYDRLKPAGLLSRFQYRFRRDANAQISRSVSGLADSQLLDPGSGLGIGPIVSLHVCRGVPGIPSRVGVVFFHRLLDCRVQWDLNCRSWCVECP